MPERSINAADDAKEKQQQPVHIKAPSEPSEWIRRMSRSPWRPHHFPDVCEHVWDYSQENLLLPLEPSGLQRCSWFRVACCELPLRSLVCPLWAQWAKSQLNDAIKIISSIIWYIYSLNCPIPPATLQNKVLSVVLMIAKSINFYADEMKPDDKASCLQKSRNKIKKTDN